MDGKGLTVLAEVNLHMADNAVVAVDRCGVVHHVCQDHPVSGPEVRLHLRVGHDTKRREDLIRHDYSVCALRRPALI